MTFRKVSRHRKRSFFEIELDVLNVITKEARPTWIMYEAHICWSLLEKALASLLSKSLIKKVEESHSAHRAYDKRKSLSKNPHKIAKKVTRSTYYPTSKGKEFLALYRKMRKLYDVS